MKSQNSKLNEIRRKKYKYNFPVTNCWHSSTTLQLFLVDIINLKDTRQSKQYSERTVLSKKQISIAPIKAHSFPFMQIHYRRKRIMIFFLICWLTYTYILAVEYSRQAASSYTAYKISSLKQKTVDYHTIYFCSPAKQFYQIYAASFVRVRHGQNLRKASQRIMAYVQCQSC